MTTTTCKANLRTAHGVKRRLLLKIDGVETVFWQDDGTGAPPSSVYTVTGTSQATIDVTAVSLSAYELAFDGDYLYIGDTKYNSDEGRVLVYKRSGVTWALERTISNPDAPTATGFGHGLAAHNGTVAIGAPYKTVGGYANAGVCWVFTGYGAVQEQELQMAHYGAANQWVGTRHRVCLNGDQIFLSAPGHNAVKDYPFDGALYYWTRSGTTWTEIAEVADPSPKIGAYFGSLLSFDGTRLLVSRNITHDPVNVYVMTWDGAAWGAEQIISVTGQVHSLAISGTIFAVRTIEVPESTAALSIYELDGTWSQTYSTSAVYQANNSWYGRQVAITDDGQVASARYVTSVDIYSKSNGAWALEAQLLPTIGTNYFPTTLAIGGSGTQLYVAGAQASEVTGDDVEVWGVAVAGTTYGEGKVCLQPPQEFSTTLDMGQMWQDLSAMTFDLLDIADTDGTSYFGKLFAPARWDDNPHWRLKPASNATTYVYPGDTTITLNAAPDITTPCTVYFGPETMNATANAAAALTVVRGLWPCTPDSTNWAYAFYVPETASGQVQMAVGQVPFTLMGRRVALYVSTYDTSTGTWDTPANSVMLWLGRISEGIQYDPQRALWRLTCKSVLQELDKTLGGALWAGDLQHVVNLQGDKGRKFYVQITDAAGTAAAHATIEVPAGVYNYSPTTSVYTNEEELLKKINTQIDSGPWTIDSGSTVPGYLVMYTQPGRWNGSEWVPPRTYFAFSGKAKGSHCVIWPWDPADADGVVCHALQAFGFDCTQAIVIDVDDSSYVALHWADSERYSAYQPLHYDCNGGKIYFSNYGCLNQGDYGDATTMINLMVKGKDGGGDEGSFFFSITALGASGAYSTVSQYGANGVLHPTDSSAFAGQRFSEAPIPVQQIYLPSAYNAAGAIRGPFEQLLFPLLSTGAWPTSYNGDYDRLPQTLSVGIEASLVNTTSFTDADKAIANSPLAYRMLNLMTKPTSYRDLLQRECQLFGRALCWRNGKLTLRDVVSPPVDTYTLTLDESTRAVSDERPTIDTSIDTVVNEYECKFNYNPSTDKYGAPIIVTDVDSAVAIATKRVTIEHPGVQIQKGVDELRAILSQCLLGRVLRYPSQTATVTLAPSLVGRVYTGDVVRYTSSYCPDPLGSGTMSTTCYAVVLNAAWNFKTWTGKATLFLLSRYVNYGYPWAPSALVNACTVDNGWNASTQKLTLVTLMFGSADNPDDHDGNTFAAGDKVQLIPRSPWNSADAANILCYGPYTVAAAYGTDGTGVVTLNDANATLTGLSNTEEWVLTYANYADCVTDQLSYGIWQASRTNYYLDVNTRAYRWG